MTFNHHRPDECTLTSLRRISSLFSFSNYFRTISNITIRSSRYISYVCVGQHRSKAELRIVGAPFASKISIVFTHSETREQKLTFPVNFACSLAPVTPLTPISYVPLGRLLIINFGFLPSIELQRSTIYDAPFYERTALAILWKIRCLWKYLYYEQFRFEIYSLLIGKFQCVRGITMLE